MRRGRGGSGRVSGSESETWAVGEGGGLTGECGGVSRPRENDGTSELAMEIRSKLRTIERNGKGMEFRLK